MPQPSFNYTIVTEAGDRNIKAKAHHSDYSTLELWLKENMPFAAALKPGDQGTLVKEVYEGHDRQGKKVFW